MNSKNLEKSKGVVLFAFNTDVDYVTIADRCSRLISHNLKLPVTLVTGFDEQPKFEYDNIIRVDNSNTSNFRTNLNDEQVTWRNFGRYLAYEFSPYDQTLLLDSDYMVFDDSLLKLFESTVDYRLMHHNATDRGPSYECMGETSLPYIWATVVLFNKTEKSRMFFDLIGRIQRNYGYYKKLYNIREGNYRNDYAFAIANNIINGYTLNEDQGIPWCMLTIDEKIESIPRVTDNFLQIRFKDRAVVIPRQSVHVMDKDYLLSRDFEQVIEATL